MISIKQIKNFLILAETLHFAKAAAHLGISQATLSCEIKMMEKKLGIQLFDRSDKWSIKLTAAGKSYYEGIKNIPNVIQQAEENALKTARGKTGHLSIAVSNITYDYVNIGNICKIMTDRYPEVKLKILDMAHSPNRFECLSNRKADLAIFAGSNNISMPEGLVAKNLMPLEFALAVPKTSALAEKAELKVEDLKNTHFILPPADEAPNLRRSWEEIFMEHCHKLPIVTHEVLGSYGTLQFVAAGLGAGFIFMPKNNIFPDKVVLKKLPVKMNRSLLVGFQENNNSPVIKNFLQILNDNIHDK